MASRTDWIAKGFAHTPDRRVAPPGGVELFRAWGGSSTELGSGYFSLEEPASVLDAELRFNIADWGNGIHFVTRFLLKEGFEFYVGLVSHGSHDLTKPGTQVYVPSPIHPKIIITQSRRVLRQDVSVVQRSGNA